jgi:hypothetical protein
LQEAVTEVEMVVAVMAGELEEEGGEGGWEGEGWETVAAMVVETGLVVSVAAAKVLGVLEMEVAEGKVEETVVVMVEVEMAGGTAEERGAAMEVAMVVVREVEGMVVVAMAVVKVVVREVAKEVVKEVAKEVAMVGDQEAAMEVATVVAMEVVRVGV